MTKKLLLFFCLLTAALTLSSCGGRADRKERTVRVVLEEGDGFTAPESVFDLPSGTDLSVRIAPEEGWQVTGCDYEGALLETDPEGQILLTLPGHIGYRQVDRILQRLPSYDFIHGHMINIDPDPLCGQSNLDLRRMYESAITDVVLLIRRFLPAVHGKKPWPALMDHDFESC